MIKIRIKQKYLCEIWDIAFINAYALQKIKQKRIKNRFRIFFIFGLTRAKSGMSFLSIPNFCFWANFKSGRKKRNCIFSFSII